MTLYCPISEAASNTWESTLNPKGVTQMTKGLIYVLVLAVSMSRWRSSEAAIEIFGQPSRVN